ncbi:2-hydroxyacyl-CoA dehydratase family protein [Sphingomonas sp. RT2P30]|uniref:2-hydroxyacyl-CoA dehydratase family protein n=1 Tax=Parasphingomonas halimpatiens TaxID=3096162 RepID=UPI002FC65DE8
MTPTEALAALETAAQDASGIAAAARVRGKRVVWTLGADLPQEMVRAFGYQAIRLVPGASEDHPEIDALISRESLGSRGRRLLGAIAALPAEDALLISHTDNEQPQLFATLRELGRCGAMALPPVAFVDLLTTDRPATARYNALRIRQTLAWLATLGGDEPRLAEAIAEGVALRAALARVMALRPARLIGGAAAHRIAAATAMLDPQDAVRLLDNVSAGAATFASIPGERVVLGGSLPERPDSIAALEARGPLVVGEDHGWGEDRAARRLDASIDPVDALARSTLAPWSGPFADITARATRLVARAREREAHIVYVIGEGDESTPWQAQALRAAAAAAGVAVELVDPGHTLDVLPPKEDAAPRPPAPRRSRKSLAAVADFGAYQRDWFAGVRAAVAEGAPFMMVNANTPQECLRAMGIPFVVNQWWASIVAAKQQGERYAGLLEAHGLPSTTEAYSAQGVAAVFDDDDALAPWGGVPRPDAVSAVLSSDATPALFQAWASAAGATLHTFERSIESRWEIPIDWWDGLAARWDEVIEPERLDLMEAELRHSIAELEAQTGRRFDAAAFEEIMNLVNEQEDYYRRTRDLIAVTVPVPVGVVDTMPATMVPQWHRGTPWARDAAKAFHDEVVARVAAGGAACPGERLRLMFVGRGLWSDMSFYQRWEESHGAVFVWSMYLALAADGYIRHHDRGRDPMRALAARFVTMGDELRMPTWAGAWYVKEARLHQVDGVMALSDADPLVLRALREAGFAVLELGIDNYVADPSAGEELERRAAAFLDGPVVQAAARRGAASSVGHQA